MRSLLRLASYRGPGPLCRAPRTMTSAPRPPAGRPGLLGPVEREERLAELGEAGWTMAEGRDALTKRFTFASFNQVSVTLTSHDCGGVTERDVRLARFMDRAASTTTSATTTTATTAATTATTATTASATSVTTASTTTATTTTAAAAATKTKTTPAT
ncbi:pterin-4-alpha-carbinolamine dehydratase 2 isoform X2 [Petromyzon marinus]|uniref:pterin-4-alpha-carbinolamine dehydratase 2 isoform X2 n=1 Tax=Petromyzon marinus TaxID=7757 RepID=UPI003F729373